MTAAMFTAATDLTTCPYCGYSYTLTVTCDCRYPWAIRTSKVDPCELCHGQGEYRREPHVCPMPLCAPKLALSMVQAYSHPYAPPVHPRFKARLRVAIEGTFN